MDWRTRFLNYAPPSSHIEILLSLKRDIINNYIDSTDNPGTYSHPALTQSQVRAGFGSSAAVTQCLSTARSIVQAQ